MAIGATSLIGYTEMNNNNYSGTTASISGKSDRAIACVFSEGINHYTWTESCGGSGSDNEYYSWAGNWYDPGAYIWMWWESTIASMTGSGTPTFSLTRSSGNHGSTFALYMFDTVDQTAKVVDSTSGTGAGTSVSVSCSTDVESGDVLISAVNLTYNTLTHTGSGTDIDTGSNSVNGNGYDHGFAYQTASTTSVSETWTGSGTGAAYYGVVLREAASGTDVSVSSASVELTTYAATITGTAFTNDVAVGLAQVEITTYQAAITGTAFATDVAVGLAQVELTTYAATITGTAPGTDVSVGLAQVEITAYSATITGTSPSTDVLVGVASVAITTYAATITGTTGIDYALKIGALTVDVRVGGHQAISAPMAHEVRRNAQGKAISSITSSRGYKGRWPITTVPMSSTAADTLETAITTGLPLTVTGWLVGGTVTAKVVGDVTIEPDTGLNYTVSFELQEA